MSSSLASGTYRIVSFIDCGPWVGTGIPAELQQAVDFQVFHKGDFIVWKITEKPDEPNVFRFALKDVRSYTGARKEGVFVTDREDADREWRVVWDETGGAYTIELNHLVPSAIWTLDSDSPFAKVGLEPFGESGATPLQLFQFVSVGE